MRIRNMEMKRKIGSLIAGAGLLFTLSSIFFEVYAQDEHKYNGEYSGNHINRLEFPLGGIGAGMIGMDGIGKITQVAVRNNPDLFRTPFIMAAIAVKDYPNSCKVLERVSQDWKILNHKMAGNGAGQFGFPCFENSTFKLKFPFAEINLQDKDVPLEVTINAWSPFVPLDEDNSSLPVAALEYTFKNVTDKPIESVFSFHAENFMRIENPSMWGNSFEDGNSVMHIKNGFVLSQSCTPEKPHYMGDFAIFTEESSVVDYRWFRGGWFDAKTQLWNDIRNFRLPNDTSTAGSTGASLYVPVNLKKGESKTVKVLMAWYVPHSELRMGKDTLKISRPVCDPATGCCSAEYNSQFYEPWYSARFKNIFEVSDYWLKNNIDLQKKSELFAKTFYLSTLAPEVLEAIASNLAILKSPTVLRQKDGKLWGWEGCFGESGCCFGSCTHVWNYAQSISHLFPVLERSLRETEFMNSQDSHGRQTFRTPLPIRPAQTPTEFAAADGQLGGIMKVYREWRISGDIDWLHKMWKPVKESFLYCSNIWDPNLQGIIEEPHHNTYDIEFWGPDGMCTSYYLGALQAMIIMGEAMNEDIRPYKALLEKGKAFMENDLYNGEYFIQKIVWDKNIQPGQDGTLWGKKFSPEALEIVKKEGPKYQYGKGCLSDGVVGAWLAEMCGLPGFLDENKIKSHLNSVYKYNLKKDLSDWANPQRSNYAFGKEGGLVLCTWPKGDELSFPFVYSNEVWTGIEYQVASHLMLQGEVGKGLEIVREVRKRYDGTKRNPFDEYECGHWYARAMASYGLIQGLTGIRYDAVEKCLYIDSKIGDFTCFFSTETGYGTVTLKAGIPSYKTVSGVIEIQKFNVSGHLILKDS